MDLVHGDEWEEVVGDVEGEEEAPDAEGVEEEDLQLLPPGRRQRTSVRGEGRESSPSVGRTPMQARAPPSSVRLPSLEASGDAGPWAVGGTPVQRKVTSSLGRRSRDNLFSEGSQVSGLRDKRLCMESAQPAAVPSSPPTRPAGDPTSLNCDMPSSTSEKAASRKYWRKEFVPERNRRVHEIAKKFLQAEVLSYNPWPNTVTIEGMVRRCWGNAWKAEEAERKGCYPGSGRAPNEAGPTTEPDKVSLGIVSACNTI